MNDITDEELERLEVVVVLTCARRHLLLWPANVHPLPDRCLVNADGWDCRSILTRRKTMVPIAALLVSQEKVTELTNLLAEYKFYANEEPIDEE